MRLVCPGCGAQYEIDAALLPETGRDVQCSACGHVWFQYRDDTARRTQQDARDTDDRDDTPPEPATGSETDLAGAPPQPRARQRGVDPDVLDVLRQEAAYEADQRKREAETLSSQPEFPLDPPQAPSPSVKRAQGAGHEADSGARSARTPPPEEDAPPDRRADASPRSGLLPDIDSISSTLQPDAMTAARSQATDPADTAPAAGRSGFLRGFTLVIALAILLLALYIGAEPLAEAVPGLAPQLDRYVTLMDGALGWTAEQVNALLAMVRGN